MRQVLTEILELLVPRSCAGCGAETVTLCGRCLEQLAGPVRATVPRYGILPVVGAGEYEDVLRSCLIAYKEHGRRDLIPVLAGLLARSVVTILEHSPDPGAGALLVPVPADRSAIRRRGANHVSVLTERAAGMLRSEGLRVELADILEVAAHRDQVGFGSLGRRRNVRDTHRVRPGTGFPSGLSDRAGGLDRSGAGERARSRTDERAGPGAGERGRSEAGEQPRVIVLDDICTTGSTVAESARALRRSRIPVHGIAVVGIAPGGTRFAPGDGI
ncbi:ComF family protein [Brevibacterium daeguense]|uniref:ComF family protein n=1 Tax=Brevibacterium daeguense TaxID=909936 RepID=A0ABP8EMG2_9MICO|nr:hypothetical protein [Brevibacterium daeguense]